MNTLASMSFNVGPTLLSWLEREAPETYARMIEADRLSRAHHGGHGNAIAMPFHHVILPLASRRDKVTEVRWGIADFERRFGRRPEGMWLPETAVDDETLDVMAAEGIAFTVLAPHQVERAPAHGLPGRYRTSGGRSIAIWTYDGGISHDVAFGELVRNAERWRDRMLAPGAAVVAVATDGETYGHHHPFAEVGLAWMLHDLEGRADVRVENFASALARHRPAEDVRLVAPSSWSCPHGVERWRSDCGCRAAPERATQQRWRGPLRGALDWLAGELHALFEREAGPLFGEPWAARDAYGAAVAGDGTDVARFVDERLAPPAAAETRVRARELLELERNCLRMFTSCGWFFDDLAGIEARQNLLYAARAIEFAGAEAPRLETGMLERLAVAECNEPGVGSGRAFYLNRVKPRVPATTRVAAGHAAARRFAPASAPWGGCHGVREEDDRLVLTCCRTGRETAFRVSVERAGGSRLRAEVTPLDGGATLHLGLADFPERYRTAVVAAWREELARRRLSTQETARVATAAAPLVEVAAQALGRAVRALAHDRSESAVGAVTDLADLVDLAGGHVPFDAQTAFDRIRSVAGADGAAALASVARRLGFAEHG
jgi:alpha-amylase/alpha-mannosidase (GH57 family)